MAQPASVGVYADISQLQEIVDRRTALARIGRNTRALDLALAKEADHLERRWRSRIIELKADDGGVILEYVAPEALLKALAEAEVS